ncbi:MAG: M48 family metallopeptidase [Nitrososphaera sp.]
MEICVKTSSRAKRLRLVSGIEGVRAVVPPNFSSNELSRFVTSKRDWLRRTSRYYERLRDRCGGFDRSDLLYQGVRYRSLLVADRLFSATVSDALRTITFHVPDMRKVASYQEAWYRQQTCAIIGARLPILAESMCSKYNKVSVKKQKSRWGSCSRKGNLNFNLMLAAAPPEVLDYVMIHELAHLSVLDHSPRFWALVQAMDPDYRNHREWLTSFAPLIKVG